VWQLDREAPILALEQVDCLVLGIAPDDRASAISLLELPSASPAIIRIKAGLEPTYVLKWAKVYDALIVGD
jgi:hypothetical protein